MTRSASLLSPTTPRQVGSQLTAECRHRAIRCVAQLAMNQIAADPDRIPPEVSHEHPDRTPQLRDTHLQRQALIYIRPSTLIQVRENTGSTARQYHLADRARQLGWLENHIRILDQDQGCSGASSVGREGFEHLVTEVSRGRAGAVFSLEASRLARSCSDWYRWLESCALTDTLVIDDDGIYDPGQYHDRLRLGVRSTMSEAELHWLRNRLLGGKLAKATQGALRWHLPTGYG